MTCDSANRSSAGVTVMEMVYVPSRKYAASIVILYRPLDKSWNSFIGIV